MPPIEHCTIDNKPGLKWGDEGYPYTPGDKTSINSARNKVNKQAAINEIKKINILTDAKGVKI